MAARVACSASSTRAFFFFHFHFGGCTDFDYGDAAGEFRNPLLQLLLVVVGAGLFDLRFESDLMRASMSLLLAAAVDDGGVFLIHDELLLALPRSLRLSFLERTGPLPRRSPGRAGEGGDVFQHGLTAVAEARCLDGNHFDDTADGVDHQCGQGFAFHVFRHDQQLACPLLATASRIGSISRMLEIFLSCQQDGPDFRAPRSCPAGY